MTGIVESLRTIRPRHDGMELLIVATCRSGADTIEALVEALEIARGEIARVHQLRSALPQIDAALSKARGGQ